MTTIAELTEKRDDLSAQLEKVNMTRSSVAGALNSVENLKRNGIALEEEWDKLLTKIYDGLDTLESFLEEEIADIEG